MEYSIRSMRLEDIDAVYAIEVQGHKAPWSRGILVDCILVGYDCRVIEKKEDNLPIILGYSICRQSFNVCHILNLCIAPSYQHQGVGTQLLSRLLDMPMSPLINTFILEVRPSNYGAIHLYEKMGFLRDGVKEGYYEDQAGVEDAWLYKKVLE
ncbi:GCN5-related N-acetyltransferase [Legionella birminghamensis]|uniref:[Ribosomal protein bS18]-alanine N-acetyltransferase n=1 Tax=Legionella birminghamensis TaxID=28083 RepID=A0A378I8C6_9GAMM|nr:ribosomal protein S18-alanine N-acetyltransferase [Legionella birminghamensis]KTC67882.1 GCN5-related N-acetyltransferase [Legionella birminghamensis]STX31409.1 GCN5-related N-acetyltransferase [Legionella birminghamensis]